MCCVNTCREFLCADHVVWDEILGLAWEGHGLCFALDAYVPCLPRSPLWRLFSLGDQVTYLGDKQAMLYVLLQLRARTLFALRTDEGYCCFCWGLHF